MRRSIKAATDIVSATASVAEGWLEELYPQYPLETIPESSIPPGHAVVDETPNRQVTDRPAAKAKGRRFQRKNAPLGG